MTIIKPALEGIGSASGVAWPLFGILSTSFNLAIGGTVAFILGSICGIAFLLITLAIAYITYQNLEKQKQNLERKKEKYESLLLSNIISLFATLKQYEKLSLTITLTDFLEKKAQELDQSNTDEARLLASFLRYLKTKAIYNTYNPLEPKVFNSVLKKYIRQFLISQLNDNVYLAAEKTKLNTSTFQAFIGTFGTLAGGSAGLTGLLIGLGLMSSFSLIPWVGIAIIVTTAIVAIYMADKSARNTELNSIKTTWCKQAKNLGHSIQRLNIELREQIQSNQITDYRIPTSDALPAYLPGTIDKPHNDTAVITDDEPLTNTPNLPLERPGKYNQGQGKFPCESFRDSSPHAPSHLFFNHKNLTKENEIVTATESLSI